MNYKSFNLGDWIGHISGVIEDETTLDGNEMRDLVEFLSTLEQEPKTGHCKDCKWWKDSDGVYRRGIGAESQCSINSKVVFEGNGYCYMFEPQETETWNGIHAQITAPKGTFDKIWEEAESEENE